MKKLLIGFFLKETLGRFFTKTPKYFKIWQVIMGGLFIVTFIPDAVSMIPFSKEISEMIGAKLDIVIRSATAISTIMLQLTTQSMPQWNEDNTTIVKTTDEAKLPFTANQEVKLIK